MGEVYRATDTTLKRQVALKILPASFAADPDRLARLQREAEVLASLNHPNIAAIYGLQDAGGAGALVMELVEGPTLADRVAQGAIPIDEALPIAKQIAEGLEAAHEQGVIHRDLKPANIKVRPDGMVKVLDFGLAKAMEPAVGSSSSVSVSPTITTPAITQTGMILGTAAYMSPEQAKGRPADKRSDVWAFGVVLYEMLTGRRAFTGDEVSEVLASVLAREPDWTLLPRSLSPVLVSFLKRCLHKDPKQRVPDIATMSLALDGVFDPGSSQRAGMPVAPQPMSKRLRPIAAGALIASVAVGLGGWSTWPAAEPRAVTRFDYVLPQGQRLPTGAATVQLLSVSPDGRRFVYVTPDGFYVRSLGELNARLIPSASNLNPLSPIFSPDGQ